jgi:hypothetical protein
VPIVDAPVGRRDEFVDRYFSGAEPDQIVVILKARESARILTAIGKADRWHLQYARRWVMQYNSTSATPTGGCCSIRAAA